MLKTNFEVARKAYDSLASGDPDFDFGALVARRSDDVKAHGWEPSADDHDRKEAVGEYVAKLAEFSGGPWVSSPTTSRHRRPAASDGCSTWPSRVTGRWP